MSDFVYDGTTVPDGKSDLVPLTGTASKHVTAAEWNTVMAAIQDLRDAILTGNYHGLISDPTAAVSPAAGVRLRNNAGVLQVSQNGGTYANLSGAAAGEVRVADYGAVGDDSTDDTAALTAAFAAAVANNSVVVFETGKVYKITSELRLGNGTGKYCFIEGRGAELKAYAAMNSVLKIQGDVGIVRDLLVTGYRYANYGVYFHTASESHFENVKVYQCLFDGFKSHQDSDRCVFINCNARICGRVYHTAGFAGNATAQLKTLVVGTVAKTSGATCVITLDSGSLDFTDYDIRDGDFISVHATAPGDSGAEWLQIKTVDSATQMTCNAHPASTGAASGLEFSIHVGDGFHFGPGRADNNIHMIDTCLAENTAGAGFKLGGLYGPRCVNLQVNAAGTYPVVVATSELQTIGSSIHGFYTEVGLNGAGDHIYLGGAAGITIDTVNADGNVFVASDGFSWGTITNMQNAGDPGRIDPIGSAPISYIPVKRVANNSRLEGTIKSRSHPSSSSDGDGYLLLADNNSTATTEIMAGTAWQGGNATFAATHLNNTGLSSAELTNGAAEVNLLTRHLLKVSNYSAFKFGVGMLGDIRTTSSDQSGVNGGLGGSATIDKPAGRFAIAAGATAATITDKLCVATSKIFITKQDNDTTAVDFKVVPGAGSFVVTANAAATAKITFDFFIVNASTT